mgnify:CR=1 FL=1
MKATCQNIPQSRRHPYFNAALNLATGALLCCGLLLVTGCGDGIDESAENVTAGYNSIPDSEVPEIEIPSAEDAPELAAVPEKGEAPPTASQPGEDMDETEEDIQQSYDDGLEELNDGLEEYVDDNGTFPKSIKVLIDEGTISGYPVPPPGKGLYFNKAARKFEWVDAK